MMEGSPIKNLNYFVRKNPPITLVIICLLFLTITTCTLAYYSQHKSHLLNTDVLLDIYQLKKFINDLKVCIKPGDYHGGERLLKRDIIEEQMIISTSVPMKNLGELNKNITQVQGLINLKDFRWSCPDSIAPKYLEISFNTSDRIGDDSICVELRGPRKLLENILPTHCQSNFKFQSTDSVLETTLPNSYDNFCENGTKIHFNFDRRENSGKFAVFLSKDDQMSVSRTLLWCTYILVVICLLVILIVSFYTGKSSNNLNTSL